MKAPAKLLGMGEEPGANGRARREKMEGQVVATPIDQRPQNLDIIKAPIAPDVCQGGIGEILIRRVRSTTRDWVSRR